MKTKQTSYIVLYRRDCRVKRKCLIKERNYAPLFLL